MNAATMTIRVDQQEKKLIQDYAKTFGMSVSEVVRQAILEKIEDELDLKVAEAAHKEFLKDPVVIPFDEVAAKYL